MTELIKIRGVEIGQRGPAGAYLHQAVFRALPPAERVAAYLALVWPHVRTAHVIEHVCVLQRGTCASVTEPLRNAGAIRRQGYGKYGLARE